MTRKEKRMAIVDAARDLDARLRKTPVEQQEWLTQSLPLPITSADTARAKNVLRFFGLDYYATNGCVVLIGR